MQTEKKAETKPRKKTRTRKLLTLSLILLAVLILSVVVLLPIFVSSEKVSKTILAKINDSIDGQADFADLSMGWFKGIKITNISFNDNQGRVTVAVKQISTKPHYASVLTGTLSLGETVIDEPKIQINLDDSQPAEKPTQTSQDISVDESPTVIVLPVKKINLLVNNGDLKVTSSPAQTVQLSNINSRVNLRPPGKLTAFDMDMTIVGADDKSKISAEGQITPDKKLGWTLEGTSGDVIIEIDDLDLGSLAPLFALAGVELKTEGRIFAEVKTEIEDGQVQNLNANLRAKNLDVTGGQLGSDILKISELDATVKLTAAE